MFTKAKQLQAEGEDGTTAGVQVEIALVSALARYEEREGGGRGDFEERGSLLQAAPETGQV